MKKVSDYLTIAMAALFAVSCVMPMAQAHTPLAGIEACPSPGPAYAPLPQFVQGTVGSPIASWPAVGTHNFCAHMDTILCQLALVSGLLPEVLEYANLLRCLDADINGPVNPDPQGDELPITPNGVPDGQYELAIVAYALNTPAYALHTETLAAYQFNFENIKNLIQQALDTAGYLALVPLAAPYLIGGLTSLLAGYATTGDPTTLAALDMLLGLLSDIGLEPPEGGIASITQSVPALGIMGDADGDGSSNYLEYQCFVVEQAYTAEQYVAAVFDNNQFCITPTPIINSIKGGGKKRIGTSTELIPVTQYLLAPIAYEWSKDGVALGVDTQTLLLENLQESDSGYYEIAITYEYTEEKATDVVSKGVWLTVTDFSELPAAGVLGLLAMSGAFAIAGMGGIRRRRK